MSKIKIEELDAFTKLGLARSFLNYWWVKDEAIKLGRLKSCRAMKIMRLDKNPLTSTHGTKDRSAKIDSAVLREHYQNLKFIVETDKYIQDRSKFTGVTLEFRKGRIIVNCDRPQAIKNYVLKIISSASNLPDIGRSAFLLGEGPTRFSFSYVGMRKFSNAAQRLEADYQEIKSFLEKLRNTIELANRIAPLIPNIENYYYFDRNKHPIRIEFTGVPREDITANQVLLSAVKIKGLPKGQKSSAPGVKIPTNQIPEQNTPQQELLRYVNREILSRRRI